MISGIPVYGLTGNMGMGKSTVADNFRTYRDVFVIDADIVNREVLRDPANKDELALLFGPTIFTAAGIDTKALAHIVFNDQAALHKLEQFNHPKIWARICAAIAKHSGSIAFAVVEETLLYETYHANAFDGVIVVSCLEAEQYRRLQTSRGLTKEEIGRRLARQTPIIDKLQRADFIVSTDYPPSAVTENVQRIYEFLKSKNKPTV